MALGVKSQLDELIRRNGPITFAEFQSVALYDPEDGFFSGAASTSLPALKSVHCLAFYWPAFWTRLGCAWVRPTRFLL